MGKPIIPFLAFFLLLAGFSGARAFAQTGNLPRTFPGNTTNQNQENATTSQQTLNPLPTWVLKKVITTPDVTDTSSTNSENAEIPEK